MLFQTLLEDPATKQPDPNGWCWKRQEIWPQDKEVILERCTESVSLRAAETEGHQLWGGDGRKMERQGPGSARSVIIVSGENHIRIFSKM